MATATQRFRAAQTAAAAASVSFATRLRGLIAAINPLGIAVSLAITGLIMLAMRKDAAARAADHMADRESNLGKFIDANTGKIIEQNKALLANERIKARDRAKRSEEHTSELQSLMRTSYAVFCLKKKHTQTNMTQRVLDTNRKQDR